MFHINFLFVIFLSTISKSCHLLHIFKGWFSVICWFSVFYNFHGNFHFGSPFFLFLATDCSLIIIFFINMLPE